MSAEVATGDVIKWGGSSWDEGTDLVLSEDDVEQMLNRKRVYNIDKWRDLAGGAYNQITGIGDRIEIESDGVLIDSGIEIGGDLIVSDNIGSETSPIEGLSGQVLQIVNDNNNVTGINNSDGVLMVDTDTEIAGKIGPVISGEESVNESGKELSIFVSETEIESDSELLWESSRVQLGIRGISDIRWDWIKYRGRVTSWWRVNGRNRHIGFKHIYKSNDVEELISILDYADINNTPNISLYELISDMDERLSDYYTKEELTIKLAAY